MRRTWEWTAASSSDHYTKERRKYGMQYYCYVYYDENWQATYVGKGVGGRVFSTNKHPQLRSRDHAQVFYFDEPWQAYECEIELIAFWGRECDGGCLKNKALGGPGCSGYKHSAKSRQQMSKDRRGEKNARALAHIITTPTGDQIVVKALAPFCRENKLDKSHMCKVAKGKLKHHKGYSVRYLEAN